GGAGRAAHHPGAVEFGDDRFEQIEHGFEQRYIHHLAITAAFAFEQRQYDTERRMNAGQRVAHGKIRAYRAFTGKTVHVTETADAFTHRRKAGLVGVGAVLAVARDTRVDPARSALPEIRGAQLPAFHHAGTEVLHHHVGTFN